MPSRHRVSGAYHHPIFGQAHGSRRPAKTIPVVAASRSIPPMNGSKLLRVSRMFDCVFNRIQHCWCVP